MNGIVRNGGLTSREGDARNGRQCSQEEDAYYCQEHGYDEAPPWQG